MELIQVGLFLATLFCSLVAGLVFAFAIVVMPGIKSLGDRDFLQSFKVMDRVIQNNQPIFIFVWLGSAVILIISTGLGFWQLEGFNRVLLIVACAIYVFGVQLPTVSISIPLNNWLQSHNLESMTESALEDARRTFESRWIRWNIIRTILAIVTTALLIFLLIRL